MRRIVYLGCLALVCVGCSGSSDETSSRAAGSPACLADVIWHGARYYGQRLAAPPRLDLDLGPGAVPACRDVNGGEAGASRAVEVRRISGVDPTIAIGVSGDPHGYLAGGFFVQLPSHPLHAGSADQPDELAGCLARRRLRLEGTVERNGPSLVVGRRLLFVDAHTRFERLSRGGLPFVAVGRRVQVDAVACRSPGARGPKIVARRISPTAP